MSGFDWTRRTALGAAIGAGLTRPASAASPPRRIVSLNPCLDAILVHVADRGQIAALSHYSRNAKTSTIARLARTLPFTYESAEEILALAPDLVIASSHTAPATRQALARLDIAVATFAAPNTIADSLAQIVDMSQRVGRPARGQALVARIEAALEAAARGDARRPIRALIFQASGLVAGAGTLPHEAMQRLGFENVAARYGVNFWGSLSLERLIADPPELLLSGTATPGAPTWAERLVTHPALARIAPRMKRATFPEACLYCAGPVLIHTAAALAKAREDFWA